MNQEKHINPYIFFREATIRICGSLDIEAAMSGCVQYLGQFMPATRMYIEHYEPGPGIPEITMELDLYNGRVHSCKKTPAPAPSKSVRLCTMPVGKPANSAGRTLKSHMCWNRPCGTCSEPKPVATSFGVKPGSTAATGIWMKR